VRVVRALLDNFTPAEAARAVALRAQAGGGPDFEISGGLVPADLSRPEYAGIEYASLGCLTSGAGVIDLALEVQR